MTSSGRVRGRLPQALAAEQPAPGRRRCGERRRSPGDRPGNADAVLVTGGSGIALGLPENFRDAGLLAEPAASFAAVHGAGRRSVRQLLQPVAVQLAHHLERHPGIAIRPDEIIAGALTSAPLPTSSGRWAREPIAYSTAPPDRSKRLSSASARAPPKPRAVFRRARREAARQGDHADWWSGAERRPARWSAPSASASSRSGRRSIRACRRWLRAATAARLGIALKSGNFGAIDFYDKAIRILGEGQ